MLILDEPTAGLDPKQIIETRDLIRSLAGDHTIVLSTHILPEVAQTCQRVVIINKGRVVAVDTPDNLTARLKGAATMYVQVDAAGADAAAALAAVPGVTRVASADQRGAARRTRCRCPAGAVAFEVESEPEVDVRRELARAVVTRGWGLLELRPVRMSLEDIFLQLTTEEVPEEAAPCVTSLAIADKELRSYFASPIAYIIIGLFALLFGCVLLRVPDGLRSAEPADDAVRRRRRRQHQPDDDPRRCFQNAAVIILFVMPMITMRTYSEEKRSGTIELLLTSPLTDLQIILGKFLGALALYATMLLVTMIYIGILFGFGKPGMAADRGRLPRAAADGRLLPLGRAAHLEPDEEPDRRRVPDVRDVPDALDHQLARRVIGGPTTQRPAELPVDHASTSTTSRGASSTRNTSSTT